MANEKSFPKWKRLFALLKIDNRKEEIGFGWNWVFNSEICRFKADSPGGKFERLTENPILEFADENKHIEDPFLWYDESRKKFCMIAKDDSKNGDSGITGEWGAGFYAESDDCIHFEIPDDPKVYSRNLVWEDGRKTTQCNLERPSLLFDENGGPIYLFCASGDGDSPYAFKGATYVVGIKLERK